MKKENLEIGKVYTHQMEIYKVSKNKVVVNFYYERLKLVKIEEDTDGWYGVFETYCLSQMISSLNLNPKL